VNGSITTTSLGTVLGATAAVSLVLLVLQAVLPGLWSTNVNRLTAFVLSIAFVEVAVYLAHSGSLQNYLAAFFVGCQVTLAVLAGAASVVRGIVAGAKKVAEKAAQFRR
jgi:hypothetical protein